MLKSKAAPARQGRAARRETNPPRPDAGADGPSKGEKSAEQVFLLSPANLGGKRAKILLNPRATFPTALRLREGLASLGEVFAFLSGLYFRGKLAYAGAFSRPPAGVPGSWVITSNRGLLDASTKVDVPSIESLAGTPIEAGNPSYRAPLVESARRLRSLLSADTKVVLLGSIATEKYAEPLLEVFGEMLVFPVDFVGRGDMSRGALLLRRASAADELVYTEIKGAVRSKQTRQGKALPGSELR